MLGIAAIVLFIIGAALAFGAISGISVVGIALVGAACLAAHLCWPWTPWQRPPR